MIAAVLRCITVALAIAITDADGDRENQKLPPVVLNATTLPILRGSPRFAAVRCPKRALPSPLADGAAAKATTYLPHVHTLVATRRRPFLDDSSLDDALEELEKKKKTAAGRAAAE